MTTEQPAPNPAPDAGTGTPSADERQWGMIAHLSALIGLLVGFMFLGPLIVWLMKKDQSEYVSYHGREALNFQITWLIIFAVLLVVGLVTCGIGLIVLPVAAVVNIIFVIIAGLKANEGERYQYPFSLRLVK